MQSGKSWKNIEFKKLKNVHTWKVLEKWSPGLLPRLIEFSQLAK